MANDRDDLPRPFDGDRGSLSSAGQSSREIIMPRDPDAGPVTAVRSVLLQTSLAQLRKHGYFERYQRLVDKDALALLCNEVTPGWIAVDVALAHYDACDNLMLSLEEIQTIGSDVGERLTDTTIVSSVKRARDPDVDLWAVLAPIHRVWGRLYQGGSVQVVKLGPREQLLEFFGFSLDRSLYFRQGKLSAITEVYAGFGVQVSSAKFLSYSTARDESVIRLTWL